jgi:uncharacterized damage-inducible protein DinB
MEGMAQDLAGTFLSFSERRMGLAVKNIHDCVTRLTDDQLWQRGGDHENSVANLLLHLAGNIRQWIMHGVAGHPDIRQRDEEFSLTVRLPREAVLRIFDTTLEEARSIIATLPHDDLMTITDPQPGASWGAVTKLEAIYLIVGHLQQHTGQIILLTKQMTATDLDLTMPRKR